jgi:hypothetical protein
MEKYVGLTEKYAVYEIEDGGALPPGSFFVLRQQDIFAVQAIWGYVNALRTGAELIGFGRMGQNPISVATSRQLNELADELSELAQTWQETNSRKVPD